MRFWNERRLAPKYPVLPETVEALACAVDHVVWAVSDLDQAIEQFVERMGFPLLYGPTGSDTSMRIADIGLGSCWLRLVERREWTRSEPLSVALRSALPLEAAEQSARERGFESGGVFVSAGRGDSARLPLTSFILLRGVVAHSVPGILLIRYFGQVQAQRIGDCMRFLDSPTASYGLLGMKSIRAEISEERGADRWMRLLGRKPGACRNCWTLAEGGCIEAVLGLDDRISSIVLQASNTRLLQNAWRDAGVNSEFCQDTLFVEPPSAGGVRLQIRQQT